MAKRGYKLQEFVAHSGNVNCLRIGRKTFRHFLTGGDDQKVNLWSIGKPTCLMSLSGHTSPVESVAFNSAEVLVLAGSSSGAIKLWDLEETKMVRSVNGHRSYCTAIEFHPFGEFFGSGSMDTNLKIWDIRKKGCIHTYKGHTRGISTIRFSPDGRWVVSGGLDNIIKVWDLTAGKLLHDFKFHEGHIRSLDFHPLEFLLATGSADRTVKFWDLETFEMIGSTRREGSGVRSLTFHPDGRTLFCGLDDSLKVFSWEPVICHDSVDMGWSTLGDLCIHDEKLLGGAYHDNSVGVWVADVSLIKPSAGGLMVEQNNPSGWDVELQGGSHLKRTGSHKRSSSHLHSSSSDTDPKDIKNIYIDTTGENCVTLRKEDSINSPIGQVPLESKEMNKVSTQKQGYSFGSRTKGAEQGRNLSFIVPNIIPRDIPEGKESFGSEREPISTDRSSKGMPPKSSHILTSSNSKFNMGNLTATPLESEDFGNSIIDKKEDVNFNNRLNIVISTKELSEDKHSDIKNVAEKFEKPSTLAPPLNQNGNELLDVRKGANAIKVVNGVAVVRGRTRSLVERFERRESLNIDEVCTPDTLTQAASEASPLSPLQSHTSDTATCAESKGSLTSPPLESHTSDTATCESEGSITSPDRLHTPDVSANQITEVPSQLHTPETGTQAESQASETSPQTLLTPDVASNGINELPMMLQAPDTTTNVARRASKTSPLKSHKPDLASHIVTEVPKKSMLRASSNATSRTPRTSLRLHSPDTAPRAVIRAPKTPHLQLHTPDTTTRAIAQMPKTSPLPTPRSAASPVIRPPRTSVRQMQNANQQIVDQHQQIVDQQETGMSDISIVENLMESHDALLSTFRSRLTKLQVVRHFWERKDVKGAINATKKLPDQCVQADIVSVLTEKMEIITLDLFSCLLPVLLGLLDSNVERHAVVSLEMLLKLVSVFGPMVHSTVSAPPVVGVDLHAEQRLECCKECFAHLQNIQKMIPALIRRGGVLAKSAMELNLVLQEP